MTDRITKWRNILLDPCNLSAQRRNTAAIRDSFEEINNYFITNITNQGDGTDEIVFFQLQASDLGDPDDDGVAVKALDLTTFEATGADYTLFDYTPNKRFARNFVNGYYGVGKKAPEIQADALVVIELEGRARWIDGTFAEDMGATTAGQATVDVDNYWGAFPNIRDPGAQVTVYDRNKVGYNAVVGNRFMAVWDEQDQKYILVNVDDEELVFFRVKNSENKGDQFCIVEELEFTESMGVLSVQTTGREFTCWDPSPNLRFSKNFVEHYYGCGRRTPELADDALICVELEGLARFIDGTLAADMSGGEASANVSNFWGAFPNFQDPGTPVTVYDRNNFAVNAKSGDRYIAVWDEQDDKYIIIIPSRECKCGFTGEMEYVQICTCVANSCCLWDAYIKRIDAERTVDFCKPVWCYVPVWLWDYNGVDAGDDFPLTCNTTTNTYWCDFAKLVKRQHNCDGDIRDVYAFSSADCNCIPCPEYVMTVRIKAFDCIQEDIEFSAYCVDKNPMVADANEPGFWGEVEITGEYPVVGHPIPVEPLTTPHGIVDEVYAISGCNGFQNPTLAQLCRVTRTFYENPNQVGDFHEYIGNYSTDTPFTQGPLTSITERVGGNDCQHWCTRTFRYGVFVQCAGSGVTSAIFYHLHPDSDITRVPNGCYPGGVPSPGDEFGGASGSGDDLTTPGCCEAVDSNTIDTDMPSPYACLAADIEQDLNGRTLNHNPLALHVLGGCRVTYKLHHPFLVVCEVGAGTIDANFEYDWSGSEECKDL